MLKRERNQNDGVLSVTGRQIEEQELAMTFQPSSGHWLCAGKAAEREVSQGKQEILALLRAKGTMTPSEIAQAMEKPRNAIALLLSRMVQEKLIVKGGRDRMMAREDHHLHCLVCAINLFPMCQYVIDVSSL